MRKILSEKELKDALHDANVRKGSPLQFLCDPIGAGAYLPCKALVTIGPFKRADVYLKNPHKLLKELEALPDRW
jgi:hypothetical protein